jgi:chromosome segregation ATPase
MKTSQQLERELNASKAEVERLKKVLATSKRARASLNEALDKTLSDLAASKAEVERLTGRMKEAKDLIDGWKKERKAHLLTCKNAQSEIDKLYAENVCLQELIQELYEWTRRDYPTEQEVREIMNRYHDLLNK